MTRRDLIAAAPLALAGQIQPPGVGPNPHERHLIVDWVPEGDARSPKVVILTSADFAGGLALPLALLPEGIEVRRGDRIRVTVEHLGPTRGVDFEAAGPLW